MNLVLRSDVHIRLRGRGGRPAADRRAWVVRPDDLVVLDFELVNLAVQPGADGAPARLVRSGTGPAYLIVTFPPQHLAEIAYFTTVEEVPYEKGHADDPDETGIETPDPAPIRAVVSGWSRLVFRVPDDRLPIAWSLESLLEAMRSLELSVPVNALPPAPKRLGNFGLVGSILETATLGKFVAATAANAGGTQPGGTGRAVSALRPGAGVIAASRARRQLRVGARALGITESTGSSTIGLHAVLVDSIAEAGVKPFLLRPEPRPPSRTQTALEIPHELFLSPDRRGAWLHASAPVTAAQTGHTELWHTRLGVRGTGDSSAVAEGPRDVRTVRAVWTTAGFAPTTPPFGQTVQKPDHANLPYRMSLDSFDRHSVVHLSSNFRLQDPDSPRRYYEPEPIDVKLLALSSLGAWLDSRGAWDVLPLGLSVEEWRHRATLGRDHYVRVVYRGRMCPWGHRASVVKVTERQFHPQNPGNPAYLRQRMFLVVREPVRTYRNAGHVYDGPVAERLGEKIDLMLPFTAVRITTVVSPLLDPPESDHIAGKLQGCFWPRVGGQPFRFHLVGTDVDGRDVDFTMPLIFVGKEETDEPYDASIVPDDMVEAFETHLWPGSAAEARDGAVPRPERRVRQERRSRRHDLRGAVDHVRRGGARPAEVRRARPVRAALLSGRALGAGRRPRPPGDRPHVRAGERRLRRAVPPQRVPGRQRGRGVPRPRSGGGRVRSEVQQPGRPLGRPGDARSLAERPLAHHRPDLRRPRDLRRRLLQPQRLVRRDHRRQALRRAEARRHPRPRRVRRARQAAAVPRPGAQPGGAAAVGPRPPARAAGRESGAGHRRGHVPARPAHRPGHRLDPRAARRRQRGHGRRTARIARHRARHAAREDRHAARSRRA